MHPNSPMGFAFSFYGHLNSSIHVRFLHEAIRFANVHTISNIRTFIFTFCSFKLTHNSMRACWSNQFHFWALVLKHFSCIALKYTIGFPLQFHNLFNLFHISSIQIHKRYDRHGTCKFNFTFTPSNSWSVHRIFHMGHQDSY